MPRDPGITESIQEEAGPIDNAVCDWYFETGIINRTCEDIFVLHPNGSIEKILSDATRTIRPYVEIITRKRDGKIPPAGYNSLHKDDNKHAQLQSVKISKSKLDVDGGYIDPVSGLVIATAKWRDSLKWLKRDSTVPIDARMDKLFKEQDKENYLEPISGFTVLANCHDITISRLYLVINNKIVSLPVKHCFEAPEMLTLYFRDAEGKLKTVSPVSWIWTESKSVSITIDRGQWIMGTDYSSVYGALIKKIEEDSNKISLQEVEKRINVEVESYKKTIDAKDTEIASLKQQLKIAETNLKIATGDGTYGKTMDDFFKQKDYERKDRMAEKEHSYKMEEMDRKERSSFMDGFMKYWPVIVSAIASLAGAIITFYTSKPVQVPTP